MKLANCQTPKGEKVVLDIVAGNPVPPTLLYHRISRLPQAGITWLTPNTFKDQMQRLSEAGFTGKALFQSTDKRERRVLNIAFDDGLESVYSKAFPTLSELGFTGTVFIPSGYIGKRNLWDYQFLGHGAQHMDATMLCELVQAGWQIGSHTVTHRALTSMSDVEIKAELHNSKVTLEDLLGQSVSWVSFPFGRYDQRIINLTAEIGYQGICTHFERGLSLPDGLLMQNAKGIYLWDTQHSVLSAVEQWDVKKGWQIRQNLVSSLSGGTILWRKIFPLRGKPEILANPQ
ncbi:polysaccharide deacetylase family protein [Calditrichota bacterium]